MVLTFAVFIVGALVGSIVIVAVGPGFFYQTDFDPAISLVCGGGFQARIAHSASYAVIARDHQLLQFLKSTSGSFNCPRSVAALGPTQPLSGFAQISRYLMYTVAALWKIFGISWTATYPLFAVLYGVASAAVYLICRTFVSRATTIAVALAFMFSPIQEQALPQLRDYSAAPFMLIAIAAIALVVWRELKPRELVTLAGVVGLELGIGFGFRTDMSSALIPFLAVVMLSRPLRSLRVWKTKALAAAFCVAAFVIAGIGILPTYVFRGSNSTFVVVEGNTAPFNVALHLQPQDLYDAGYEYNDSYALGLINGYAHLIQRKTGDIKLETHLDDKTALSYYLSVVRQTPGDFVVRGIAATTGTLDLGPYSFTQPQEPSEVSALGSTIRALLGFLHYLPWTFALFPATAALILLWRDLWRGSIWIAVVLYFGALNELQFNVRHSFYLEIFWWLSCAIVLETTIRFLVTMRKDQSPRLGEPRRTVRRLVVVAGAAMLFATITVVGVAGARLKQEGSLKALFSAYQTSPRTKLVLSQEGVGNGKILLTPRNGRAIWHGGRNYKEAFLAATFGGPNCGFTSITPELKYRASDAYDDFSTRVPLTFDRRDASVTKYFVALKSQRSEFAGIELGAGQVRCVESLAVVRNTARLPTLLDATLPTHWESASRYQRFDFELSAPLFVRDVRVYGDASAGLPSTLKEVDVEWRSESPLLGQFTVRGGGWSYSGIPISAEAYIASTGPVDVKGGSRFVVEGNLKSGGATFGLQAEGKWVANTAITGVGRFVAVLDVRHSGKYTLVGTANSSGEINLEVKKVAILSG